MSKAMRTTFIIMAIIIIGLVCAVNTEAATVKYAKNVSDIDHYHSYVLEAAEYPMSSTKKVDGWVATPDSTGWMGLKKYNASTAKANSDEVYVTFENEKGERFCRHMKFQNGELSRYDQFHMDTWFKGSKPIAWMPLPKPFEGGTE